MAMAFLRLFENENDIPQLKEPPSDKWKQQLREAMRYTPDAIELEQTEYQNLFVCDDLMIGYADHGILEGAELQAEGFTRHNFSFFRRNSGLPPFGIPLQAWDHGMFYPHPLQGGNRGIAPRYLENGLVQQEEDGKGKIWTSIARGTYKTVPLDNPISSECRVPGKTYAPIRGEIHKVPSTLFANSLDKFKENGSMFVRRRIPIVVRGFQEWETKGEIIRQPFQRIVECWMYIAIPDFWNNLIDGGYHYQKVKHYEADKWDSDYGKFVLRRYYWYNEF